MWSLPVAGFDDICFTLPAEPVATVGHDRGLRFAIPGDNSERLYLLTVGGRSTTRRPSLGAVPTVAEARHRLTGRAVVEGEVSLWSIRFGPEARCGADSIPLQTGQLAAEWTAEAEAELTLLALRLSGTGALWLDELVFEIEPTEDPAPLRTGRRGGYRAWSLFADPSADLPMAERHRRHYRDRRSDWYTHIAAPFAGARRVLDLGGGPGLLAAALLDAGVDRVESVERDPEFAEACRRAGATVHEHDLGWPMPFLERARFDGAVAYQVLDYLPSVAQRGVLRELHRVMSPDARCTIALRLDGPATGDPSRPDPTDPRRLEGWAMDVGFALRSSSETAGSLRMVLERAEEPTSWIASGPLVLPGGHEIRPWSAARPVFTTSDDAWDDASRRDFTPLTTPEKDEAWAGGELEAVYTGYRTASGRQTLRAVCRAVSRDGASWQRDLKPMLEAGAPGAWDAGGVAAGSFVRLDDGTVRLFYSGLGTSGSWTGIGVAERGEDGIWQRSAGPLLTISAFASLRHLALADVLRRADGTWLMHLEGMRGSRWAIVQARSADGSSWTPTSPDPVLSGEEVAWAGTDVANPKCLDLDGLLVLAFNGSGRERDFQCGFATSSDGIAWQVAGEGPVLGTVGFERRVESLFMTRSAWQRGDRTAYHFRATTPETHASSDIVSSVADREATWPRHPWRSPRLALYQIRDGRLLAQPGAQEEDHALVREHPLARECQCSGRVADGLGGGGTVRVAVRSGEQEQLLLDAAVEGVDTWAVRVLRPRLRGPEVAIRGWHRGQLVVDSQAPIDFPPATLRVSVTVPPSGAPLTVDHVDVWSPEPEAVTVGDAHVYGGIGRTDDPLLPDLPAEELLAALDEAQVGRALAAPYGATGAAAGFDELARAAAMRPGLVHPLLRLSAEAGGAGQWTIDQLELLWQQGRLYGLKVHLGSDALPAGEILDWIDRRELPTLWHVARRADLDTIERTVLPRLQSPVLLSHFAGYPLDRARYARAIELLDEWPQLHLVTSMVWFAPYLRQAAERHPDRVLLGSDFPAVDPVTAQSAIRRLGLEPADEQLVLGGGLRFILGRATRAREHALVTGDLLFPPLPRTSEELDEQGFEVVGVAALPTSEPEDAKSFWASYGMRSFYREPKPWQALPASLALETDTRSALEFGCNRGRNLSALREAVPEARLVGVDVNPEAVAAGRVETGLDLRLGDEGTLSDFDDGAFELVFTVSVLDHIVDVDRALAELVRCASRIAYFLEVALPAEGKVRRHFDHAENSPRASTEASYSWDLESRLREHPRTWRVDRRPVYLHPSSLGPYYVAWTAWLDPPI